MTERERWVVYPLLFLALGASLRDKLGGSLTAKRIVCQELLIEDEPTGNQSPRPLAILKRTDPLSDGRSAAVLAVDGEVQVNGIVKVDGVVSTTKGYAYGDNLIMPAPQRSVISLPDLLQALKNAQARQQQSASPNTQPPAIPPAANSPTSNPPDAAPRADNPNDAAPSANDTDNQDTTAPSEAPPQNSNAATDSDSAAKK